MMQVRKRNGVRVPFDREKIATAVAKAVAATGWPDPHLAARIATLVEDQLASESEACHDVEHIQDLVEMALIDQRATAVAKAYILYRAEHNRTRDAAQLIQRSTELIRQYLDKLDWKVSENSNMSYSLQGLNNYIASEITSHYWLNEIYPPYLCQLHRNGDLHLHDLNNLSVYCCGWDLSDLIAEGFCGVPTKVSSKPARHFRSLLGQIVNFLYSLQGEAAGAQAFANFDTYLAPFVAYDKLTYQEVKQCLQEFVFNLNVPTRVGFQTPFTNITLDLTPPASLAKLPVMIGGELRDETYGQFQQEMDMINRAFAEVMLKGDAKGKVFPFPIPTYNITKDFNWDNEVLDPLWEMTAKYGIPYFSNFINSDMSPDDARSMCCRLRLDNRELRRRGGGLFGSNPMTGSIGVVTLNMARLGHISANIDDLYERLDRLMDASKESLQIKRQILEKLTEANLYPYSKFYLRKIKEQSGFYWNNHFNTIGVNGMNECMVNMLGKDLTDPETQHLTAQILSYMRDRMSSFQEETGVLFNLEATPGEGVTYRFAKSDQSLFGTAIHSANHDAVIEQGAEPYYTNSSQLPVGATDDIFDALDMQDQLQTLYTGGTVLHGFLGERLPNGQAAKRLVKAIAENYRLPYFTLTPTFSICPIHGYIAGEHEFCPLCDAEARLAEQSEGQGA